MVTTNVLRVAVVGTGLMGRGIAQSFAVKGFDVNVLSRNQQSLDAAVQEINWSLSKFVDKGALSKSEAEGALSRITTSTSYEQALFGVDLVVESVSESMELKKQVFSKIDAFAPFDAILATNTSALSVTEIGRVTRRPEKTVGMHWFIPPQLVSLIEVVKGNDTAQETLDVIISVSEQLGKTPVLCKKDVCGFIVSRILVAVFNEAFSTYSRKEATIEEIDSSVKHVGGFPMGWFELVDFVGVDIEHNVSKILYEAHGGRFYPYLEVTGPLVISNNLGKKSGLGFYDWANGRPSISSELKSQYNVERSWAVAVNEAAWIVFEGVAEPESIDLGMKLGTGWHFGPCEYADNHGLDKILDILDCAYRDYSIELYRPCPLLKDYVEKGWTGKSAGTGFFVHS